MQPLSSNTLLLLFKILCPAQAFENVVLAENNIAVVIYFVQFSSPRSLIRLKWPVLISVVVYRQPNGFTKLTQTSFNSCIVLPSENKVPETDPTSFSKPS